MKPLRAEELLKSIEATREDCVHLKRLNRDDPGIVERLEQVDGWLSQVEGRIRGIHLKETQDFVEKITA